MWNPALEFEESCTGTLVGWHRAFYLRLTAGRETACQSGRMLVLKEGGRTTGVVHHLPGASPEREPSLLWKREMITGYYLPTWCQLALGDDEAVNALVFIMDPRHPLFESDMRAQVVAPLIAVASGPLGTNAQCLFSLEQELVELGMQNDCLNDLVITVKRLLGENLPEGVMRSEFARTRSGTECPKARRFSGN